PGIPVETVVLVKEHAVLAHRQLRTGGVLLEVSDGSDDLRSVECVDLAGQHHEIRTQSRLNENAAIVAGCVDNDDVVPAKPFYRVEQGRFIGRPDEIDALRTEAAHD
ncbi:hypothetical protein ABTF72_18715, partial [Acinetobacter baumannii]